jgi:hypothetical protein
MSTYGEPCRMPREDQEEEMDMDMDMENSQ